MRSLLAALSLAALSAAVSASSDEILVFGAASLTESLQDLGQAFTAKTGTKVTFSFGSSSDLARQIQAGAPADVFFSADTATMDGLEKAGRVQQADRREFLSNALVVVVPAKTTSPVRTPEELAALPRIALAEPSSVPAGIYAKKWLESAGLWEEVSAKVVPTLDVRAALAAVESEAVPAAVVYRTDAAMARRARIAFAVAGGPEILYSVAPVGASRHPGAARAFVAWLAGDAGRAEFEKRGFVVRPSPSP